MAPVYLDYNATTPLDPLVLEAMMPALRETFGNPSSTHQLGRSARVLIDNARDRLASFWRCKPSEVVFTSGGTESNALALIGSARALAARGRHLVCSAIEHHSVLQPLQYLARKEGFSLTVVPVSPDGVVSVESVVAALRQETTLVSVMASNNETGAVQPVAAIGSECRSRGIVFHTDAAQSLGKAPFSDIHQFQADLVTACAHKFHGPKGSGALFIRSPLQPVPILLGGGHENERRAGTENVAAILGFVEAFARFAASPVFAAASVCSLTTELDAFLLTLVPLGVTLRSPSLSPPGLLRLPNTVACTVRGADSTSLLAGLDLEGFCASSGSACSSGSLEPSHVLRAMGLDETESSSLLRFSLGRSTTASEIDALKTVLPDVIARVQRFNNSGVRCQ